MALPAVATLAAAIAAVYATVAAATPDSLERIAKEEFARMFWAK